MSERRALLAAFGAFAVWLSAWWSLRSAGLPEAVVVGLRVSFPLLVAVAALRLAGEREPALRALGLRAPVVPGLTLAAFFVAPMLAAFAVGGTFVSARLAVPVVLFDRSFGAAFGEEVFFRGFLFLLLARHTRLGVAGALVATAALFGGAHVPGQIAAGAEPSHVWGTAALTAAGGGWFAWLLARWGGNLWLPIGLHALMNLAWVLFAAGPDAVGGGTSNLGRGLTIALSVIVTLAMDRWPRARQAVDGGLDLSRRGPA